MSFIKRAKFIEASLGAPEETPIFKKCFTVNKNIIKAELEISALGVYEAYINGKRVGNFVMAPGWTEYEERIPYQSYDITDMLSEKNTTLASNLRSKQKHSHCQKLRSVIGITKNYAISAQ